MDIDGIPLRSVLVVDDKPEEVKGLVTLLSTNGVTVLSATGEGDARPLIQTRPELDLVVLDWYLNADNELEARLILKEMTDHLFAPVVIWTKHGEKVNASDIDFPESMMLARDKSVVTSAEALVSEIRSWLADKTHIKIALLWGFGVHKDLNKALWNIQNLGGGDLSLVIGSFERKPLPGQQGLTPEESAKELVLLLLKALRWNQLQNKTMTDQISKELKAIGGAPSDEAAGAGYAKLWEYGQYISPALKRPIWTGDIIHHKDGRHDIVISPACDIAQAKLKHVQMLRSRPWEEARELPDLNKKLPEILGNRDPRFHFLPYVSAGQGLVCFFEEASSIPLDKYFEKLESGELECLATLDSPFIENLIQRYISFLGRMGVPDLAESAKKGFLETRGAES